jgi:muramoyltetrapeptide carboxypeptidase
MSYHWPALQRGDIVDIVAPASSATKNELDEGVRVLKGWGLRPRVASNLMGKGTFVANSDTYRLASLRAALTNDTSRAVWCLRGGYGSMRLLPGLQRMVPPTCNKLFIGLSDISALHVFLNQEWAWPTIYGPVLTRLGKEPLTKLDMRELRSIIFGETETILFKGLTPLNSVAEKKREIKARVFGGNMATIQAGLGTFWQLSGNRRILVFEDVGERGYRVDRMLQHMHQAGVFKGLRAMIFADFVDCYEPGGGRSLVPEAIKDFASQVRFPVLKGIKTGHGPIQRCLPLNTKSVLELGSMPRLVLETGVED